MSRENVEIVRQIYDAAARRDAATVLALYDPEVEWDFSRGGVGGMQEPGLYRGHEGIQSLFRQWYEAWESVEDDCEELINGGEHVVSVVTRRGRGRASGAEVEAHAAGVWTIRSGRVVRVVWFPTRAEALEAAGQSE
jgi:ketosteroid isomerase-like protein